MGSVCSALCPDELPGLKEQGDVLPEARVRQYEALAAGSADGELAPTVPVGPKRDRLCAKGSRCKCREVEHLEQEAHPFDPECASLCHDAGRIPEEPSLRMLFDWIDVDGSGKISRKELEEALPLLSRLFAEEMVLSDDAWETLDEDGNGCVNFSELAEWAGPRLGLPLGVKRLFQGSSSQASGFGTVDACGIVGCPCEGFQSKPAEKIHRVRDRAKRLVTSSAWVSAWIDSDRGRDRLLTCRCGHKQSAHSCESLHIHDEDDVPLPAYWATARRRENVPAFSELVPERSEDTLKLFQVLFNETYRDVYTRDRKKHNPDSPNVPKSFQVVRAFRCENNKFWREYGVRRAQMLEDRSEAGVDSFALFEDVKTVTAWNKQAAATQSASVRDRLVPECNEWYLFHGTSPERAENICHNDFKISMAGSTTGTLYGRGSYFAESISKADEYAKPNDAGEYAVLLVRVLGGRVKYTDEETPDAEGLVRSCIEGPFDCILGDREKCRGTYREFVFYDTENIYAEYIIHYTRHN